MGLMSKDVSLPEVNHALGLTKAVQRLKDTLQERLTERSLSG